MHNCSGAKSSRAATALSARRVRTLTRETEFQQEILKRRQQEMQQRALKHQQREKSTRSEALSPTRADLVKQGIVLTSFNLLAPVYKRVDEGALRVATPQSIPTDRGLLGALQEALAGGRRRESDYDPMWRSRAKETLDFVCNSLLHSDIICFQEYWFDDAYQALFRERLESHYTFHTYQRTGKKADGLAVLLRRDTDLEVVASSGQALSNVGDRVALLLHLKQKSCSIASSDSSCNDTHQQQQRSVILANTHLTFPHTTFDRENQQQQIDDLTHAVDAFVGAQQLVSDTPRIIVGDFNVEEADPVCQHLKQVGYRSAFSTLHSCSKHIVTHFTHRGEELMVDHVWVKGLSGQQPSSTCSTPTAHDSSTAAANAAADATASTTAAVTTTAASSEHSISGTSSSNKHAHKRSPSPCRSTNLSVGEAVLMPTDVDASSWYKAFKLSDHRPLQVRINFDTCDDCSTSSSDDES